MGDLAVSFLRAAQQGASAPSSTRGLMGSSPSRPEPNLARFWSSRTPEKQWRVFGCCGQSRICDTPALLPSDTDQHTSSFNLGLLAPKCSQYGRGWKENFRYRNLLLSGAVLRRLEIALLELTCRDFQNFCEWEKFQLWLQEVKCPDQITVENKRSKKRLRMD